ncbi:MAG TPA: hypothetical protein VE775_07875, partial [Pyrinomonadaceae bacterium]|nr:hypothetical protein [Pyrinomonadaceae bacterium]
MATKKSSKRSSSTKRSSAKARASAASTQSTPIIFVGASAAQVESMRAAKRAASARLLQTQQSSTFSALAASTSPRPEMNLVGVGLGEKISGGKHTGIMAVKLLVRIKYPDNQVLDEERLPTEINGHPVDVEQVGT